MYEQEDPNVVAASNDASNERRLHYWDFLKNHLHAQTRYMEERKRSVCVGIGACHSSDFEIPMSPVYRQQEFWNETCYICQAAVKDMEVCL